MGKIKELRQKEADGTITEDEKTELDELESEAAEKPAEEVEKPVEGDDTDGELGKQLAELGKGLAASAVAEVKRLMGSDEKKGSIVEESAETKELKALTGKEKTKAFFVALFENDRTKLDHLSEGTNADGGFLVPQEYASDFVVARQNLTVMRRAGATTVNMVGDVFNLPSLATRPRAYWANELAVKSSTSASWGNQTLTPYTLAAIMTASNQVIADAKIGGNIIDIITRLMTEAIAFEEDKAFFVGSGSGQPTGLTTYTPSATIAAGGAINADLLINAVYRLRQGYRNTAAWFMNSRTLAIVRQLKDGQNRYIFENAISDTGFPTILGRPVYEQDDMASTIIWFGDAVGYWIGDREGVSVKVSDTAVVSGQSGFERNFTAVRVEERVDGELADTAAFVRITGLPVA